MKNTINNFKSILQAYKMYKSGHSNVQPVIVVNSSFEEQDISSLGTEEVFLRMLDTWLRDYNRQCFVNSMEERWDDIIDMMYDRDVDLDDMETHVSEYNHLLEEEEERRQKSKVSPLLTQEQIIKIKELKNNLPDDKDPMRKSWQYTTKELGVASLILSICNNNKDSYLLGLRQIFSKPRANAILKKLVS
jgi:hypothetical protein